MAPFAPARFSTDTCCPNHAGSSFAASRPMKSVPPPAGYGTIILIGFCGQDCAPATAVAIRRTAAAAATLRGIFRTVYPLPIIVVALRNGLGLILSLRR